MEGTRLKAVAILSFYMANQHACFQPIALQHSWMQGQSWGGDEMSIVNSDPFLWVDTFNASAELWTTLIIPWFILFFIVLRRLSNMVAFRYVGVSVWAARALSRLIGSGVLWWRKFTFYFIHQNLQPFKFPILLPGQEVWREGEQWTMHWDETNSILNITASDISPTVPTNASSTLLQSVPVLR